jgi:hypothetical protein
MPTPTDHPDPKPQPPERPLPTDCCEGGCAMCVYDFHEQEMETYRKALAAWMARHPEVGGTTPPDQNRR